MAFHKITRPFNRDEPTTLYYGYKWEVREDGIYADVIDELVEGEIAAGRIFPNEAAEAEAKAAQEAAAAETEAEAEAAEAEAEAEAEAAAAETETAKDVVEGNTKRHRRTKAEMAVANKGK